MSDLRQLRESCGMPRLRLADEAGVSIWKLNRFESGHGELTEDELKRCHAVLAARFALAMRLAQEFRQKVTA